MPPSSGEFSVTCTACRASLTATAEELGMVITCPCCSTEITLPLSVPREKGRVPADQILVTSATISQPHEIAGMVCFSLGTRGAMGREYQILKKGFTDRLEKNKRAGQLSEAYGPKTPKAGLDSEGKFSLIASVFSTVTFDSNDTEIAFMIAVSHLQQRASLLDAHAVTGFRWDLDLERGHESLGFTGFAYGTAVKILAD